MVKSSAGTVDEFIAEAGDDRRPALERIRDLSRSLLSGWAETMQYGMPGYGPPGEQPAFCFNDQKQYISLYPGSAAVARYRDRFRGASFGRGCIRFPRPDRIDFGAVAEMLKNLRVEGRG